MERESEENYHIKVFDMSPTCLYYMWMVYTLSALLKKAEARRDIHGVKVCRGAPILTHLLFVDDCFLFCRRNPESTNNLTKLHASTLSSMTQTPEQYRPRQKNLFIEIGEPENRASQNKIEPN